MKLCDFSGVHEIPPPKFPASNEYRSIYIDLGLTFGGHFKGIWAKVLLCSPRFYTVQSEAFLINYNTTKLCMNLWQADGWSRTQEHFSPCNINHIQACNLIIFTLRRRASEWLRGGRFCSP